MSQAMAKTVFTQKQSNTSTQAFTPKPAATQQTSSFIKTQSANLTTPPKKKMPVFVPREQDWSEEPLPINSNNIYQLLASPGNKTLDELVKDPSVPILAFTGTLLQEIRYITHKLSNSEYAVFLALRRIDKNHPHFLAYDFFMPEQKASGGGVALDPKDCQRHFDGLKTHPYYQENGLHRHLCHLHSHAGMQVFWSSTDDTQQLSRDDLGFMDDFRFYCVVNTKDEIKCSFVFYKPVLARVDAAVAVSFAGHDHAEQLTKKRRAELDEMIDATLSGYSTDAKYVSEFGGAAKTAEISNYGGADCHQHNFHNNWGNTWENSKYAERYSKYDARNSQNESSKYTYDGYWDDGYWDSFHGNNSDYAWEDPDNKPTDLGWFAFLDNYKRLSKISDTMLQEFLNTANVDRKYSGRARKLLSWVMDRVFGTKTSAVGSNGEFGADPDQDVLYGELIGAYVGEFMHTLRASIDGAEDFDDKMYLTETACQAIRSNNKEKIIEAVIDDLSDYLNDTLY